MGPIGFLFYLGATVWVCAAYMVVRKIKPNWGKALVIAAFVLVPTADAVYGRIKLKQLCEAEGGVKIYRTVEGVEGFYNASFPSPDWLTTYGYRFVEGKDYRDGKSMRIRLGPDGKVIEEKNVVPQSKYRYELSLEEIGIGYLRFDIRIRDLQTKEILARDLIFIYKGGWAERFLAGFSDDPTWSAADCRDVTDQPQMGQEQFITRTLKPAK